MKDGVTVADMPLLVGVLRSLRATAQPGPPNLQGEPSPFTHVRLLTPGYAALLRYLEDRLEYGLGDPPPLPDYIRLRQAIAMLDDDAPSRVGHLVVLDPDAQELALDVLRNAELVAWHEGVWATLAAAQTAENDAAEAIQAAENEQASPASGADPDTGS